MGPARWLLIRRKVELSPRHTAKQPRTANLLHQPQLKIHTHQDEGVLPGASESDVDAMNARFDAPAEFRRVRRNDTAELRVCKSGRV
jgi:hypothetical protein